MSAKYGFVLFDDPSKKFVESSGGWACVHGEAPVRIRSGGDLSTGVRWVSNLEELRAEPRHVKRGDYLFHSNGFKKLSAALALNPLRDDLSESAITAHLAHLAHNVAHRFEIGYGRENTFHFTFFSDEIRSQILPPDELGQYDAELLLASTDATVTRSSNTLIREKAKELFGKANAYELIEFHFSPVPYFQKLLSKIVPDIGIPEYVSGDALPERSQRVQWVLESERPVLAKVSVSHLTEKYAGILNFTKARNVGGGRNVMQVRAWMTQPEIALYDEFARIEIDGVYLFNNYEYIGGRTQKALPYFGDVDMFGPSSAILAINHFVALSRPQRAEIGMKGTVFRKHEDHYRGQSVADMLALNVPRCAWMNAYDRAESFKGARHFTDRGFLVAHYSLGSLHVAVARDVEAVMEAIRCGEEGGMAADSSAYHLARDLMLAQAA